MCMYSCTQSCTRLVGNCIMMGSRVTRRYCSHKCPYVTAQETSLIRYVSLHGTKQKKTCTKVLSTMSEQELFLETGTTPVNSTGHLS